MDVTRTEAEIVERIKAREPEDMFGFEWHEYIRFLPFHAAQPWLKEEAKPEDWAAEVCTRDALLEQMRDYMDFAWGKANNCRGLSANRSVMHYIAWTWLAGDGEFSDEISQQFDEDYRFYGKPILARIADFYGWDWRQWDDGRWRNDERGNSITAEQALAS